MKLVSRTPDFYFLDGGNEAGARLKSEKEKTEQGAGTTHERKKTEATGQRAEGPNTTTYSSGPGARFRSKRASEVNIPQLTLLTGSHTGTHQTLLVYQIRFTIVKRVNSSSGIAFFFPELAPEPPLAGPAPPSGALASPMSGTIVASFRGSFSITFSSSLYAYVDQSRDVQISTPRNATAKHEAGATPLPVQILPHKSRVVLGTSEIRLAQKNRG